MGHQIVPITKTPDWQVTHSKYKLLSSSTTSLETSIFYLISKNPNSNKILILSKSKKRNYNTSNPNPMLNTAHQNDVIHSATRDANGDPPPPPIPLIGSQRDTGKQTPPPPPPAPHFPIFLPLLQAWFLTMQSKQKNTVILYAQGLVYIYIHRYIDM